jgi:hypothetical protein
VKSSLLRVNGKAESSVNVTSVFKTGDTDVGDMVVADITVPLVAKELE